MSDNNVPSEYKPISMWGYFGYELLFGIPVIGFIILLVFAFGGSGNINVKNFARSKFCYVILLFVIFVVLAAIGMATGAAQSIADMMS
ncbi:MAG: hypothetical protein K6A37_09010 [Saccharofermentans sp.]|jgi:hypothetical protein|nr:hypothetical protein [Clostridiales bacterium]MBP3809801.1 hypothetical protein [Clostridiales bacterium]MCR5049081.1 hypothetical protein [Saccharofermentans sp.]